MSSGSHLQIQRGASAASTYAFWVFLALTLAYLIPIVMLGRPTSTDETFFKAAGFHWVFDHRWAAPEEGTFSLKPGLNEVFFTYPPLYSFFFSLIIRALGFCWRSCVLYDAIIHLALLLTIARFLRTFFQDESLAARLTPWLVVTLLIPFGTFGRPDELAATFGYAALCVERSQRRGPYQILLVGILLGMTMGTSVPCAFTMSAFYVGLSSMTSANVIEFLKRGAIVAAIMVAVFCLICAPIVMAHPDAIQQNLQLSQKVLSINFEMGVAHLWRYSKLMVLPFWIMLSCGIVLTFRLGANLRWRYFASWWLPPIAIFTFLFTKNTFQGAYYLFLIPWCYAGCLQALFIKPLQSLSAKILCAATILASTLMLDANNSRDYLVTLITPQSQRWPAQAENIRRLVPPHTRVYTAEYWWALGPEYEVIDASFSDPETVDPQRIDYILLGQIGTGEPGKVRPLPPRLEDAQREVVANDLDSSQQRLLGLKLSNSSGAIGPLIYKVKH